MTHATITRSAGVIAGSGPQIAVVGGGGRGLTEALDQVVQQAAEILAAAYGMDVTVRFNSDRASGGAWLRTHAVDRVGANSEVGITATLVTQKLHDHWADGAAEDTVNELLPVGTVMVSTYVSQRSLNSEAANAAGYGQVSHEDLTTALAWLREHVRLAKIPTYESLGLTEFAYALGQRVDALDGERVRLSARSRYGNLDLQGVLAVTHPASGPALTVTSPRDGRVHQVELRDVTAVEVLRAGRYRPLDALTPAHA